MTVLCTLGPGVVDEVIQPAGTWSPPSHKKPCRITRRLGGACSHVAHAAQTTGISVRPIVLTGDDDARRSIEALAREEFSDTIVLPILEESRRSIVLGDECYTVRSAVKTQILPGHAAEVVRDADLTV